MILRCTRSMTTPIRHAEQIPDAHQEKGKRCEDEGSVGGPPMICGHAGRCELAVLAYSTIVLVPLHRTLARSLVSPTDPGWTATVA